MEATKQIQTVQPVAQKRLFTTGRVTGLLYLGLAVSGAVGYMFARQRLYVPGDGAATVARLLEQETVARIGLIGELGVVAFQVLVALWFFRLWRRLNSFAAGSLAAFGLLGAAAVLVGLISNAGALQVALEPALAPGGDQAATVLLLWELHDAAWTVGSLFFGLWLIPMGYLVLAARMPRVLGWILVAGGIGYLLTALLQLATPEAPAALVEAPPWIAAVGEFWIIGYLLFVPTRAEEERPSERVRVSAAQ